MKVKILRVLAVLVMVIGMFSIFASAETVIGDVNEDGILNDADAIILRRYLAGWNVTVDEAKADVDGDGKVTSWDSVLVERQIAGWEILS